MQQQPVIGFVSWGLYGVCVGVPGLASLHKPPTQASPLGGLPKAFRDPYEHQGMEQQGCDISFFFFKNTALEGVLCFVAKFFLYAHRWSQATS